MANILTIDLDGTLLNHDNEVIGGQDTVDKLKQLQKLGFQIVINTGRLDHDILAVARRYGLPDEYRLSQNGAVFQSTTELTASLLDTEEALEIWQLIKHSSLRVELNTVANRYWLTERPAGVVREIYESQIFVDDFASVIRHQPAVLFFLTGDPDEIVRVRAEIESRFKKTYPVLTSAISLELLPVGVSKGTTLRRVFPHDKIYSIGDSENDITAFEASDFAYFISPKPQSERFITVRDVNDALTRIIVYCDLKEQEAEV